MALKEYIEGIAKLHIDEDDNGPKIIDIATTGNSTIYFYEDGTTRTETHLITPDNGNGRPEGAVDPINTLPSEDESINGTDGDNIIYGGSGDDTISGNGGNDIIYGGSGDDYLNGGSGDDYLNGGSGDDRLRAENGENTLRGGSGSDTFIFVAHEPFDIGKPPMERDTVQDFNAAEDQLLLILNSGTLTLNQILERSIQDGNDLLVRFDNRIIRLENTTVDDLNDSNVTIRSATDPIHVLNSDRPDFAEDKGGPEYVGDLPDGAVDPIHALDDGKLTGPDQDGPRIIDIATTGNSTIIFYDDGTSETEVHLLGPDNGDGRPEGAVDPIHVLDSNRPEFAENKGGPEYVGNLPDGAVDPIHDLVFDSSDGLIGALLEENGLTEVKQTNTHSDFAPKDTNLPAQVTLDTHSHSELVSQFNTETVI